MSPNSERILAEVMKLSWEEQFEIGAALQDHLHGPGDSSPEEIEESWAEELQRRMDEIDRGEVKMISHEELMRKLDEKIREAAP